MNHRWKDNVCSKCGLRRTDRSYKKLQRTYSKLINGIFEDIPVYLYGRAWFYGWPDNELDFLVKGEGFERPECKTLGEMVK